MNFRCRRTASGTDPRGKEAPPVAGRSVRGRRWLGRAVMLVALALAVHAGWIPAKAVLAQEMLDASWTASLRDGGPHRPWPWADTHPVARLRQSRLDISQIVLAGDSGRPLAFGPGWAEASAAPGSRVGTTVISGHRDTHFSWLRNLRDGDVVQLESAQGWREYRVSAMQVVDSRTTRIGTSGVDPQLLLVTCWPFDAVTPHGPMRYVVTLRPVS